MGNAKDFLDYFNRSFVDAQTQIGSSGTVILTREPVFRRSISHPEHYPRYDRLLKQACHGLCALPSSSAVYGTTKLGEARDRRLAMQLSWRPGYTQSRKPARRVRPRRPNGAASGDGHGPQQFEFVIEHPQRHQNERFSPSATISRQPVTPVDSTVSHQAPVHRDVIIPDFDNYAKNIDHVAPDGQESHSAVLFVEEQERFAEAPLWTSSDGSLLESGDVADCNTNYGMPELPHDQYENEEQCEILQVSDYVSDSQSQNFEQGDIDLDTSYERSIEVASAIKPGSVAFSGLVDISRPLLTSIPPNMLYNSLSQRFKPVFDRYNKEFCKIPITSDLRVNPFRCRADLGSAPISLVHAVMALAGHHVGSTSLQDHRHAALKRLRESLHANEVERTGGLMLDTIIVLFSLDETQSAFGNWSTHLVGAYNLLEACGGIDVWAKSTRSTAQVGMLVWWDAILSIVSREDSLFPYDYFEVVLANYDGQQWDFFGLCGCPLSLVKIVMQLARLSAEKQKSSSMRYVKFDDSLVAELEQSLEDWQHVSDATTFQDEERIQQDLDTMHCSEAWRNGLLLYLYRIFQWQPGNCAPAHILYRARAVVDHVVACRDESMVSRQALLPLFFAGCEMRDRSSQERILKFCSLWNDKTRYHMFSSTIPLLKRVWAKQEIEGFENVWWGQIVDQQHTPKSCYPLQMRLCFG